MYLVLRYYMLRLVDDMFLIKTQNNLGKRWGAIVILRQPGATFFWRIPCIIFRFTPIWIIQFPLWIHIGQKPCLRRWLVLSPSRNRSVQGRIATRNQSLADQPVCSFSSTLLTTTNLSPPDTAFRQQRLKAWQWDCDSCISASRLC